MEKEDDNFCGERHASFMDSLKIELLKLENAN